MHTNTTLYLTAGESALFAALPESLREGWTVEPETGTAYEDMEVLKVRAGMARFETYPQLHDIAKNLAVTGSFDASAMANLPESVLPELCFTIGARGVTALIAGLLGEAKTDEDVEGVVGLSHVRHDILVTNASISLL